MQGDAVWVDSLPASCDFTAVCDPTADFTLVAPVLSPPCPDKKWCGVINYIVCTRTHNAGPSFELIFMKFTCLLRVHPWVKSIVFGNNRPNGITNIGENVLPKSVFQLSFSRYGITVFNNLFLIEKVLFIFVVRRTLPQKWSFSLQIIFRGYFGKYYFFRKNCLM